MHVIIVSGSRNPEGQTARCAEAVARGLSKHGATSEIVFLPSCNLERCRQCNDDGWGICKTEMRCIIEDDFQSLKDKLVAADAVVLASPVYFKDLSESLRTFLDRLRRVTFFDKASPLRRKPALGICMAGGGGGAPSACFQLECILEDIGFSVLTVLPVRGRELDARLPVFERAGERLATGISRGAFRKMITKLTRRSVRVLSACNYTWLNRL